MYKDIKEGHDPLTLINFTKIAVGNPNKAVFILHGYGGDKNSMLPLANEIGLEDTFIILPDGIDGCAGSKDIDVPEGQGRQWFNLEDLDISRIVHELRRNGGTLASFVYSQAKILDLPISQCAIVGFSQGAIMASYLGSILKPNLASVISCSGGIISIATHDIVESNPPYVFIHGKEDDVLPCLWSEIGYQEVKKKNDRTEGYFFDNLKHDIDERVVGVINQSLTKGFQFGEIKL